MAKHITDTYDVACLTLIRQGAGHLDTDAISAHEVERRINRAKILAQCARFGVPVAVLATTDLGKWARRLGLKPYSPRPRGRGREGR